MQAGHREVEGIRVIPDFIADCVVEFDGLFRGCLGSGNTALSEIHDGGVLIIDNIGGLKKFW